ncbi:MAG: transporter substrate-binding domain-containing protein [Pseudomonas sp.]|uniref:response regulator n=1 Tax=Pseudomonas sp. TaxID=306 RepID=UPI002732EC89|nr:transporter substrate-binding domain-containing protein [Pseudomonas sp.]MDP3845147.1 transporter substrate-binding domain-containing protein [Pseudomonas sp.]
MLIDQKALFAVMLGLLISAMALAQGDISAGALVVGSEEEFPPFSTGHSVETAGGFTVELWKVVAKEAKLDYHLRVAPFSQILQEFKDGKIDVLINLAQSDSRRQFASFTVPHVTVNGAIFVRKGESDIVSETDLGNKSIIVLKADLAHDYAISRGWEKQLIVADTAADCFKLLAAGKYDAVLISKLVGMKTIRELSISNVQALDIKAGFAQKFSFAVQKNNPDLLATINEGFSLVKLNGSYDLLHEKWFGIYEDIKPSLLDIVKYLAPLLLVLLVLFAVILHKRRVEVALRHLNEGLEERVAVRTRELEAAKNLAESSSRIKGDFLANMSHEIRTPMNAITGMLYLTLKTNLSPKQRNYLDRIQVSSNHLLGLINDILDFSKIDAEKLDLEVINFDLEEMLNNTLAQVSCKAAEKGLQLNLEISPGLPRYLRGDPLRLAQILVNLTNNAVKFTESGAIIIRVAELEECDGASLIRFEVRDSGVGISEEEQSKLFQSFQQADTSTTRKYGGTGLGLVISKRLVTLMGGEIGVESQLGSGSTFWFTVRLGFGRASLEPGNKLSASVTPIRLDGAAILLVEDNLFNQHLTVDLLEDVGAVVVVASNGCEALEQLRQAKFDCVLMDVQMPEMDGLEAVRRIRTELALTELPVVAMTANARSADREHCLAAGMDDFISKPINPDLFYAILKKNLSASAHTYSPAEPLASGRSSNASSSASTAAVQDDGAIIDLSILAAVGEHDPDRIGRYAKVFMESVQQGMAEITEALMREDIVTLSTVGHRIKSSAKAVGAMSLADLCQSLENVKITSDLAQARELASQLPPLLKKIDAELLKIYGVR